MKTLAYRPAIKRLSFIAGRLSTGAHLTAKQLAEELEVSKKTVDRDLNFMRDRLNLPIETDGCAASGSGFYFTHPVNLCPVCLGHRP